ncbi:hypothetical protein LQ327_25920 [Actinomycetospora endophytica]|uniref:Uncharacterized protein n=1 Tax=Actinomycetospora endophytica TaxID=2291215 RepID=A0ABS8PFM7_9PSEU|nr:hypothetical protein [Actinomycetospora endophytica]MCD2196813.1 hypothetical protein [Actinomycetospora endophytica]
MAGRDEITALFARALDGDEHAELELGRRWLDHGDTTAERAAHALAAAALAELERDPVYRAWTDGCPLSGRVAAWARREAAPVPATGLTRGRRRPT